MHKVNEISDVLLGLSDAMFLNLFQYYDGMKRIFQVSHLEHMEQRMRHEKNGNVSDKGMKECA